MRIETSKIKVLDGQNRDNSDKSIIQSVEKEGVLVPLLVYQDKENPESYILVAGHRRLASAIHFGLKDVPAELITEDQAERARALENLDRKGLHPLDEAMEIRTLQSQGYDNNLICAMLGMEMGKLIRRSKLNNLSEAVRKAFVDGMINAATAEEYSVMPEKDQDYIFKKFGSYHPEAKTVRTEYLSMQGISLWKCSKKFLGLNPKCENCPNNVASDNILFDGADGTCKNLSCYSEKLRLLAMEEGAELFADTYHKEDRILNQLRKDGEHPVKAAVYNLSSSKYGEYSVKMMNFWGEIYWDKGDEPKKKTDPSAAKRKKEINSEYKALYEQMLEYLGKMLYEHADAYMSKYHKDERFPDKDERVVLAKALYDREHWSLDGFIYGKQYYKDGGPLEGADNKRIFAVMYLYAATGASDRHQEVWPKKPEDGKGKDLLLPKSMDIEDLFQLKTSKAKKKVLEIKEKMEALLKEFSELEGK